MEEQLAELETQISLYYDKFSSTLHTIAGDELGFIHLTFYSWST